MASEVRKQNIDYVIVDRHMVHKAYSNREYSFLHTTKK